MNQDQVSTTDGTRVHYIVCTIECYRTGPSEGMPFLRDRAAPDDIDEPFDPVCTVLLSTN